MPLLWRLSYKGIFFVLISWWLDIVGKDDDGLCVQCLLIIIKAAAVDEVGILERFDASTSLDNEFKTLRGELTTSISTGLLKIGRLYCGWRADEYFEDKTISACDWERPSRTLPGRIFDKVVEEDTNEVEVNAWRLWQDSLKSVA